jgi:hypothetical protein
MTTLHERNSNTKTGKERRNHRRHDLEMQDIGMQRWDGNKKAGETLGRIVDISAGGVRVRTSQENLKTDHQIRVRLELPSYAGICPFVDTQSGQMKPRKDWVGWMTVARVQKIGEKQFDVAGQLVDMEEIDRGMLGLYLSTQPLAA